MTRRLSATLALMVFALCLVQGLWAENSFTTVVFRALLGLVVTMGVGLILGVMIEKMLSEVPLSAEKAEKTSNESGMTGR